MSQYLQKYKPENQTEQDSTNQTTIQEKNVEIVIQNLLNITENVLGTHIDYLQERTEKTDYIKELSKSIDRIRNVLQRMRYMQHIISNNINVTSPSEQLLEKNYYSILEKYDVNSESPKLVSDLKNLFFPKKFLESLNLKNSTTPEKNISEANEKLNCTEELKSESNIQAPLSLDSNMLKNLINGAGLKPSSQSESSTENMIDKPVDLSSIQFLEMKDKIKATSKKQPLNFNDKGLIRRLKMKIENENSQQEFYNNEMMLDQQLIQGITGVKRE